MAMRKVQSNIINLAFTVTNEDGKAGVSLTQAIVNGKSEGVGLRTINGAKKSALISLDRDTLVDLQSALAEILEGYDA
jgi:hypothetical protein